MSYFSRTPSEKLQDYLNRVHLRLKAATASHGLGAAAIAALALTVAGVYFANEFAFSNSSVISARTLLFASVAAVVVFLLIRPLLGLGRGKAAGHIEKQVPAFDGRIDTFVDQTEGKAAGAENPFLDLLAEDTMQVAEAVPAEDVVEAKSIFAYAAAGVAALVVLIWLGNAGPSYWSYGTARLWGGWLEPSVSPLYQIIVEPGSKTIRQGADLVVTARMIGFESPTSQMLAKFESSVGWEEAPMRKELDGAGFEFLFAGVREPLRYRVAAGGIESEEFQVQVVEMPNVETIRLTYHYPKWAGLENLVEEDFGDIRAVVGTEVEVEVTLDKPLNDGVLRLNDQESISMSAKDLTAVGRIKVDKEGQYFVAALYEGEVVRLTDDYFISLVPDKKPTVKFRRPGRDWRATNIEEVAAEFEAADDFGLRSFNIHYTVNGGEAQSAPLPMRRGAKTTRSSHTFYLEEMGDSEPADSDAATGRPRLVPGDIISYYAAARDAKQSVQTDMYFIEVRPYDFELREGQSGGGMGMGGQDQQEISRRQKEIIAGTWNLIQDSGGTDQRTRAEIRDNATLLSEIQLTLRDQAKTLAERVRAREIAGRGGEFQKFVENLEKATEYMAPAAAELKAQRLRDSLSPQQKSLQYLRRAESIFRRIEVQRGRGGGGGGGGQASQDLLEMFELEMDLEKNQYETGGGMSSQQMDREVDEALEKLKELARRQEKLAEQARRQPTPTFSQRWQQEILRREAEELKRKLEELQRRQTAQQQGSQQGSQQGGQQGGQQQSGQQGGRQQGQQGGQQRASGLGAGGSRLEQTIQRLEQATRDMERASRAGGAQGGRLGQQQAQARARRAQERLQEALRSLQQQRLKEAGDQLSNLRRRADKLAAQQADAAQTLRGALSHALDYIKKHGDQARGRIPSGMSPGEELELSDRKKAMQEAVESMERDMQQASRRLRETESGRKLREALSDLQQSELGVRLRQAAEYIRQGYAAHIAQREETVTAAINRLRDQLEQAERLARAQGAGGSVSALERSLSRLEDLRQKLEQAAGMGRENDPNRRGPGPGESDQEGRQGAGGRRAGEQGQGGQQGEGEQPGQGQGRQQAQQSGQGPGQQRGRGEGPGRGRQPGQQGDGDQQGRQPGFGHGRGESRNQYGPGQRRAGQSAGGSREGMWGPGGRIGSEQNWGSASNFGGRRGPGGAFMPDAETRREMERAIREGARLVPGITHQLRGSGIDEQELNELRRYVGGLSQDRFAGNPRLLQEEHRKLLSLIEQLELQVRRQVEQDGGGANVRAGASEPVPERYREAVAEYYRRLSQGR